LYHPYASSQWMGIFRALWLLLSHYIARQNFSQHKATHACQLKTNQYILAKQPHQLQLEVHFQGYNRVLNIITLTMEVHFQVKPYNRVLNKANTIMEVHFHLYNRVLKTVNSWRKGTLKGYNRVLNIITLTIEMHFQGYNRVPQPAASLSFLLTIDTKTSQSPTRCALSPLQSSSQHSWCNNRDALSPLQVNPLSHSTFWILTSPKPTDTNHFLLLLGFHTYQQDTFFQWNTLQYNTWHFHLVIHHSRTHEFSATT